MGRFGRRCAVGLLLVVLTACGPPQTAEVARPAAEPDGEPATETPAAPIAADPGADPPTGPDPCVLLTQHDVAAAVGVTADDVRETIPFGFHVREVPFRTCSWNLPSQQFTVAVIDQREWESGRDVAEFITAHRAALGGPAVPLPGLGDEAYRDALGIWARHGPLVVTVTSSQKADDEHVALAHAVLGALGRPDE